MKENAPEKSRANVLIILGHFQKWLTGKAKTANKKGVFGYERREVETIYAK